MNSYGWRTSPRLQREPRCRSWSASVRWPCSTSMGHSMPCATAVRTRAGRCARAGSRTARARPSPAPGTAGPSSSSDGKMVAGFSLVDTLRGAGRGRRGRRSDTAARRARRLRARWSDGVRAGRAGGRRRAGQRAGSGRSAGASWRCSTSTARSTRSRTPARTRAGRCAGLDPGHERHLPVARLDLRPRDRHAARDDDVPILDVFEVRVEDGDVMVARTPRHRRRRPRSDRQRQAQGHRGRRPSRSTLVR